MGIYSILEAFDDSSCFHYFIRKTMNQVSTKNTNKNKRSIHPNVFNCSIPVFIEQNARAKFFISQEYPNFWLWFEASLAFDILVRMSTAPRTRAVRLKVQTQAILYLKSILEWDGSDILYVTNKDSEIEWRNSKSTQNRLKMTSFKFRVGLCRIRLFPTLISKIKWLESG